MKYHRLGLFHSVVEKGDVRRVEALLRNSFLRRLLGNEVEINAKHYHGSTALHVLSKSYDSRRYRSPREFNLDCSKIAGLLLAHGADLNARDDDGNSALRLAVDMGHDDIAQWLLQHGAEVNASNNDGETALHKASRGHVEALRLLLDYGADVNGKNKWGWTALHRATTEDIAELLLARGADVNSWDSVGQTPLHHAKSNRDRNRWPGRQVWRVLLSHGADENATDINGDRPRFEFDLEERVPAETARRDEADKASFMLAAIAADQAWMRENDEAQAAALRRGDKVEFNRLFKAEGERLQHAKGGMYEYLRKYYSHIR